AELDEVVRQIGDSGGGERIHGTVADVTDEADCLRARDETLERFGGLHVLVNNAGRGHKFIHDANPGVAMDFWTADSAAWKLIVDTNVNGPFLMAKAVTPHFLEQGFGRIVNVTVTEGTMQKSRNSPYGSSKAALESQNLIWSKDLGGTGKNVTCNNLSPGGATLTGMVYEDYGDRKLNDPDIMGPPIVWLASELSDGFNGERFIAKDWDASLPPTEAAKGAIGPVALTPPAEVQQVTQR
ncbi:MAG: SDR family NAD(P)-dependent oxidoreductase, partial [Alphaproteobacteria bacterium]|nr:SDR family NAD(P)-dependent oxidoreductase [Alphaproteobacteria bacterium]